MTATERACAASRRRRRRCAAGDRGGGDARRSRLVAARPPSRPLRPPRRCDRRDVDPAIVDRGSSTAAAAASRARRCARVALGRRGRAAAGGRRRGVAAHAAPRARARALRAAVRRARRARSRRARARRAPGLGLIGDIRSGLVDRGFATLSRADARARRGRAARAATRRSHPSPPSGSTRRSRGCTRNGHARVAVLSHSMGATMVNGWMTHAPAVDAWVPLGMLVPFAHRAARAGARRRRRERLSGGAARASPRRSALPADGCSRTVTIAGADHFMQGAVPRLLDAATPFLRARSRPGAVAAKAEPGANEHADAAPARQDAPAGNGHAHEHRPRTRFVQGLAVRAAGVRRARARPAARVAAMRTSARGRWPTAAKARSTRSSTRSAPTRTRATTVAARRRRRAASTRSTACCARTAARSP